MALRAARHASRLSRFLEDVEGHARFILGAANDQRCLDAGDIVGGGQLLGQEALKCAQIGGDAFQDEIHLAIEHVTLAHQRPVAAAGLEGAQIRLGLALQADHREDLDFESELARVHIGMIAPDIALFLEGAHASQTGWRRDSDPSGQFDIGHAPIGLKFGKNLAVDLVEAGGSHDSLQAVNSEKL